MTVNKIIERLSKIIDRDMDFRIGLRMGVGDYWDRARYLVGVWDGLYGRDVCRLF